MFELITAFYAGGAFVTLFVVQGGWFNKIVSALTWPLAWMWPA